jgi:hypothetical protein
MISSQSSVLSFPVKLAEMLLGMKNAGHNANGDISDPETEDRGQAAEGYQLPDPFIEQFTCYLLYTRLRIPTDLAFSTGFDLRREISAKCLTPSDHLFRSTVLKPQSSRFNPPT